MEQPNAILGYVYLITNLVNGKKYVGCTRTTVNRRWAQHRSAALKGSPFLRLRQAEKRARKASP